MAEIKQFVARQGTGEVVPVRYLCGWGLKKDDMYHDEEGTKQIIRESFDLWGHDEDPQVNIYNKLNVIGAAPYKAGQRMMLWEVGRKLLGTDPLNYPQEVGDCHLAGTMVTMADGSRKPIEQVKVFDSVITPFGNVRRVTRTIKKPYTGYLHTMRSKGCPESITSTADHQFLQVPYSNRRWKHDDLDWLAISDIQESDRILIPFGLDSNSDFEFIALRNVSIKCKQIPESILVDDRFARLFGLYLAEGSIKHHSKSNTPCGIRLSLGSHEQIIAEEACALFQQIFGIEASWKKRKNKNVIIVDCNNVNVGRLFHQLCLGNVYTKYVPNIFFKSNRIVRISLIKGWYDGDCGVSASKQLRHDMWRLALSCGLRPRHTLRKQASHQRVASGRVHFYGVNAGVVISSHQSNSSTRNLRDTNQYGWAPAIKEVAKEYVENVDVYCLEIDQDHAFIANNYASHNCVSFGGKNAGEYVQFFPLANGERNIWTMLFPPYLWGCGRIFIGNNQLGRQDGSVGVWQAKAVQQYGVIAKDLEGVPAYSGQVARQWGNSPGPDQKWVTIGKEHLIQSAAAVTTWEETVTGIVNGYPITIASNVGYDMTPRSDGFHHYSTSWAHQMCVIGVDDDASEPYVCILNSWGDVHGSLKDFKTGEIWPKGTLRVRKSDFMKVLAEQDSFAYSSMVGFPAQEIDREKFDLWD